MDGKGQDIRQADGKGRSLFFGKALWPALETALDGAERGRSQCVEEAEAGKGSPRLQPFFPCPPAATHRAPGGVQRGGVWREQEPRHSHCAGFGPRPQGCSRPQALPRHKSGRGLFTDNSAPQESNSRQEERGRTPHWGPPSPIQAEQPVWACSLPPIGSLQAGIGAQWR